MKRSCKLVGVLERQQSRRSPEHLVISLVIKHSRGNVINLLAAINENTGLNMYMNLTAAVEWKKLLNQLKSAKREEGKKEKKFSGNRKLYWGLLYGSYVFQIFEITI